MILLTLTATSQARAGDSPITLIIQCMGDDPTSPYEISGDDNGLRCIGTKYSTAVPLKPNPQYGDTDYGYTSRTSFTACAVVALGENSVGITKRVLSCIAPKITSCNTIQVPHSPTNPTLESIDVSCSFESIDELRKRSLNEYLPRSN